MTYNYNIGEVITNCIYYGRAKYWLYVKVIILLAKT